MNAEDVWADFDSILDLESICPEISIEDKVAIVRRVSCACCLQIIDSLHDLRDPLSDDHIFKMIEARYKFWRKLHDKLLKL